jgi:hypothetical protein
MKRPTRQSDGFYHINGKKYQQLIGSRKQVYTYETAYKTKGNLTKSQLYYNHGTHRVVSLKKHNQAKKDNQLKKHGWTAKKGKFGAVRISDGSSARKSRRRRR